MGQIQRYNVVYEPGKRTMQPFEHGAWVRTTDHLEAMAAKDEQIRKLREALVDILELGRKDTSNPKYDDYYQTARRRLEATK